MKSDLTQMRLKELLHYNPETGVFKWASSPHGRVHIGTTAGSLTSTGYVRIMIDKREYLAHRLAFLYMDGFFPLSFADHKNCIRGDNAWTNLRCATRSQNAVNSKLSVKNKSGHKGVYWCKNTNKWRAGIKHNGKKRCLGFYNDLREAAAAYERASLEVFVEFARLA